MLGGTNEDWRAFAGVVKYFRQISISFERAIKYFRYIERAFARGGEVEGN